MALEDETGMKGGLNLVEEQPFKSRMRFSWETLGWNKAGTSSCTNTEWGTTGLGNGLPGNVSQEIHPLLQ